MARRYEIDELLWLRSSPLVAKPPGLPPIEEWMYVKDFPSNLGHSASPQQRLTLSPPSPGLNLTQRPEGRLDHKDVLVSRGDELEEDSTVNRLVSSCS